LTIISNSVSSAERAHIAERGKNAENPKELNVTILVSFPNSLRFLHRRVRGRTNPEFRPMMLRFRKQRLPPTKQSNRLKLRFSAVSELQSLNISRSYHRPFFERLVIDPIVAMGYGGSRDNVVQKLSKSADEGIDGVVNEDALGLDAVYLQAKT
jgi:restriction system protein